MRHLDLLDPTDSELIGDLRLDHRQRIDDDEFGPLTVAAIAKLRERTELSQSEGVLLQNAKKRRGLDDETRARAEQSFGKPYVDAIVEDHAKITADPLLSDARRRSKAAAKNRDAAG